MRRPGATRLAVALGVTGCLLTGARRAEATYSVVAADTATRQVGGAATSCLDGFDVYFIYGSVPGRGVVVAQALPNYVNRDRAVELLAEGTAPVDIIAAITAMSFDGNIAQMRQYGIADLEGRVAAHTGTATTSYSGDRQGMRGSFVYSVQGNILTGETVLTQAAAAFEGGGCDLAERLMLALEAGADGGAGDSRCTPSGIPSDSAFVEVDREGEPAGSYLKLQVPTSGDQNPLIELRALFDEWRVSHPCPMAGAGSGGAGGGTGPAGGAAGTSSSEPREEGGCSCRTAPRGSTAVQVLWGILAFGLVVSRRWNRSALRC
jgi:MYXO-CTERM domain-containing protein